MASQLLLAAESVRAEMEPGSKEQAGCNGVMVLEGPAFAGSPYTALRLTLEECEAPPDECTMEVPSAN